MMAVQNGRGHYSTAGGGALGCGTIRAAGVVGYELGALVLRFLNARTCAEDLQFGPNSDIKFYTR